MTKYVIGMDGGGTKTDVLIMDTEGREIDNFLGGTINYNGETRSKVDANLFELFSLIKSKGFQKENCAAICIGAAGISNSAVRELLKQNVNLAGYTGPLLITGDHQTAFAGALDKPYGIILIAGTGSVCYGTDRNGNTFRAGGFGHLIDDAGSGYAIARDILASIVQAYDGRLEPTALTELVFGYLGISKVNELISYVYNPDRNKKEIAELSVLAGKAADGGDIRAKEIIKKSALDLAALAAPVIKQTGSKLELAVSGSVLLGNQEIYLIFKSEVEAKYPDTKVIKPRNTAAYGAGRLALQLLNSKNLLSSKAEE